MQNLKYYVLWKKDSKLLKEYFQKYYIKLQSYLKELKQKDILTWEIDKLLTVDNRDFILNADQASLIHLIYSNIIKKEELYIGNTDLYIDRLRNEIGVFLSEWIDSPNLVQNKGSKIPGTDIRITTNDNNPFWPHLFHPEYNTTWWGLWWWKKAEKEWLDIYEKSVDLLKEVDDWIYEELIQVITKIIPLWTAEWYHNSASCREAVWHLYMWYTIDSENPEIENVEALIHEYSHNKLNLLLQEDPIILNDKTEKYYSAIRPDARHIHWIFLWYHAFAPTMYILMKSYLKWYLPKSNNSLEKVVLFHIKTKFLQKVIKKHAKLTNMWKEISKEIDYLIEKMDVLLKQMNSSKEIILKAKKKQIEHFNGVVREYPHLEY